MKPVHKSIHPGNEIVDITDFIPQFQPGDISDVARLIENAQVVVWAVFSEDQGSEPT